MEGQEMDLQQVMADIVYSQYQKLQDPNVEKPTEIVKSVNQSVENINEMYKIVHSDDELQQKQANFEKELELRREELEFKKKMAVDELEQTKRELELKEEQNKNEFELKNRQIELENKAKTRETWVKNGAAVLGTAITVGGIITAGVVSAKENRKNLLISIFSGEVIENNGGISAISVKDVGREALRLAMNVIKLK